MSTIGQRRRYVNLKSDVTPELVVSLVQFLERLERGESAKEVGAAVRLHVEQWNKEEERKRKQAEEAAKKEDEEDKAVVAPEPETVNTDQYKQTLLDYVNVDKVFDEEDAKTLSTIVAAIAARFKTIEDANVRTAIYNVAPDLFYDRTRFVDSIVLSTDEIKTTATNTEPRHYVYTLPYVRRILATKPVPFNFVRFTALVYCVLAKMDGKDMDTASAVEGITSATNLEQIRAVFAEQTESAVEVSTADITLIRNIGQLKNEARKRPYSMSEDELDQQMYKGTGAVGRLRERMLEIVAAKAAAEAAAAQEARRKAEELEAERAKKEAQDAAAAEAEKQRKAAAREAEAEEDRRKQQQEEETREETETDITKVNNIKTLKKLALRPPYEMDEEELQQAEFSGTGAVARLRARMQQIADERKATKEREDEIRRKNTEERLQKERKAAEEAKRADKDDNETDNDEKQPNPDIVRPNPVPVTIEPRKEAQYATEEEIKSIKTIAALKARAATPPYNLEQATLNEYTGQSGMAALRKLLISMAEKDQPKVVVALAPAEDKPNTNASKEEAEDTDNVAKILKRTRNYIEAYEQDERDLKGNEAAIKKLGDAPTLHWYKNATVDTINELDKGRLDRRLASFDADILFPVRTPALDRVPLEVLRTIYADRVRTKRTVPIDESKRKKPPTKAELIQQMRDNSRSIASALETIEHDYPTVYDAESIDFDLFQPLLQRALEHWSDRIESNSMWAPVFETFQLYPGTDKLKLDPTWPHEKTTRYLHCMSNLATVVDHLDKNEAVPMELYERCRAEWPTN